MIGNKEHTSNDVMSFLQSRVAALSADTAFKYRKALSEFNSFLSCHKLSVNNLSAATICDWVTEMFRQGLSTATIAQRLNILNSLFKQAADKGYMCQCNAPREIARIIESADFKLPPLLRPSIFDKCLSTLREFINDDKEHNNISGDILVFSVLNRALPLKDIINLNKDDLTGFNGYSSHILERNTDPRRKYIFDLRQSYRTQKQIYSSVSDELGRRFSTLMNHGNFSFEDLAGSLWVSIAIRCGATASEALDCISNPAPYTVPKFHKRTGNSSDNREKWSKSVEAMLTYTLPKWYAMRLRRGVSFEEVKKETLKLQPAPELFYPVETIRKHLRGKSAVIERPFITQTVFFKTNPENIRPMFSRIGDKAWCIRTSGNFDAPYAAIPQADMLRFQKAIGVFSADSEIYPLGSLTPKPGESVILIQADYSGREAVIEDVFENNCGTVMFRVKLTTDYGYEWRAKIDARQVELISRAD